MMRCSEVLLLASVLSISTFFPVDASALGEMLGKWRLIPSGDDGPYALELTADGGFMHGIPLSGTVDQVTGEVHVSGYQYQSDSCSWTAGFDGWVALDGRTLEGVAHWAWRDY